MHDNERNNRDIAYPYNKLFMHTDYLQSQYAVAHGANAMEIANTTVDAIREIFFIVNLQLICWGGGQCASH